MKKVLSKVLVLTIIFVVTLILLVYLNRDKEQRESIIMGSPTLPTVSFDIAGNETTYTGINELYGYTSLMETQYMRDSITPIATDKVINVRICNHENTILGAEYTIETLSGDVIEASRSIDIAAIKYQDEYSLITINVTADLQPQKEYNLVFKLQTDRHDEIYYYTRIEVVDAGNYISEIEFAKNFSDATYNSQSTFDIANYIEPSPTESNDDYGVVTINSNYSQITYGSMKIEKVTEPVVKIDELLESIGCFELNYKVKAKNDYDTYQYYTINEFFRVKTDGTNMYLLDYYRTMDQIFDDNNQNISASRINLGISSNDDIEYKSSPDTNFIAFVKESGLWLMDINKNQVISLFAFESVEDADIRDTNKSNEIQVVDVTDEGDVEFLVYGYMNRGEHEGMVGMSLYDFDMNKNVVKEKIFIPFTKRYELIKETLGKLSYVNTNGVMYIMFNDCVYSIDLTGSEYVEIISNLQEGSYCVNEEGDRIAWHDTDSNSVKIMNFETEKESEIKADTTTTLGVLGFMGEDLVYGIARNDDVAITGGTRIPMYEVRIVNEEGEIEDTYQSEGFYVYGADVNENMINLHRLIKSETGFSPSSDYQIYGTVDTSVKTGSVMDDIITTELKEKEYVINFGNKVTTDAKLTTASPKEIQFNNSNSLSMRNLGSQNNQYYVYGRGNVDYITDSPSTAIIHADSVAGVAISKNGDMLWARVSKDETKDLGITSIGVGTDDASRRAACVNAILTYNGLEGNVTVEDINTSTADVILSERLSSKNIKAYDTTGCVLTQMLYYVHKGQPVMARRADGVYVLITGYDFYNVVLLDTSTGAQYKQGQEEADETFKNGGYRFISVVN
ncbi:MAG: hypothetical protein II653_00645 [Lachnospiraceae bacterium]|nr:hypothetical protein [Lachnospiraceae bacterium]